MGNVGKFAICLETSRGSWSLETIATVVPSIEITFLAGDAVMEASKPSMAARVVQADMVENELADIERMQSSREVPFFQSSHRSHKYKASFWIPITSNANL